MVQHTGTGRGKRALTIISVLAVAAAVLAVPLAVPDGSDAYTEGSAGYVIDVKDGASSDEISEAGVHVYMAYDSMVYGLGIPFANNWNWGNAKLLHDAFAYTVGEGQSISGDENVFRFLDREDFQGFSLTYTANKSAAIFDAGDAGEGTAAAVAAIVECFGTDTLSEGDTLCFKGDFKSETVFEEVIVLGSASEGYYLKTGESTYQKIVSQYEVELIYTPLGGEARSVVLSGDLDLTAEDETEYTYESDLKDVKDGDTCTAKLKGSADLNDSVRTATVNGTGYDLMKDFTVSEESSDYDVADLIADEDVYLEVEDYMPEAESTDNVEIVKTYSGFMDMYDDINGSSSKKNTGLYIGIGAAAGVVVVAGVAFILLRKRA